MQGIEIEKKYKIKKFPENIEQYEKIEIEQAYLNYGTKPTVRIRKYNDDTYILSYKSRKKEYKDNLSVCDEVELNLTKEAYEHLKKKSDGKVIHKTRYVVPISDGLKVEIDCFKDFFEGVCFAEIEFKSEEQANTFKVPDWLAEDISSEKRVKNGYMSVVAKDIEEYRDLINKQCNEVEENDIRKPKNITAKELIDSGICPTCYDKENNHCVYGDNKDKMLYENNDFECFLVGNPRAIGHAIISSKKHYKDMMEIPDELCEKIFAFAKKTMNVIKEVYKAESVYLCTMCDGPMNHFHVQLIPRYDYEQRGSRNFVKERKEYKEDIEKIKVLRSMLR